MQSEQTGEEIELCACILTKGTSRGSICDHPEEGYIRFSATELLAFWSALNKTEEFAKLLPETVRDLNLSSRPPKVAAPRHVYVVADIRNSIPNTIDFGALSQELKTRLESYVIENYAPTLTPVVSKVYITSLHDPGTTSTAESNGDELRSWFQRVVIEVTAEASSTVWSALKTGKFKYPEVNLLSWDLSCEKVPLLGPKTEKVPLPPIVPATGSNATVAMPTSDAPAPSTPPVQTSADAILDDPASELAERERKKAEKRAEKKARREARNRARALQPIYLGVVQPGTRPTHKWNPLMVARTAHPAEPVPPGVPSAPSALGGLPPEGPAQVPPTPHGLPARPSWTPGRGRGALPEDDPRYVSAGNAHERTTLAGTAYNATIAGAPGPSRARPMKGNSAKPEIHRNQPIQRPSASGSSSRAPASPHPAIKSDKDHASVKDTKDDPKASNSTASSDDKGKTRAAPNPPPTGPICSKRPKANSKGKGRMIETIDLTGDSD